MIPTTQEELDARAENRTKWERMESIRYMTERDAALAEVARLKAERDKALALSHSRDHMATRCAKLETALQDSRKPIAGSTDPHPWGKFLLEKATEDPTRLSDYAAGAYSACTTLEEFQSVTANLERAREIAASNTSPKQP